VLLLVEHFDESRNIAHRVGAAGLSGMMSPSANRKESSRQRDVAAGQACGDDVPAGGAHLISLLKGKNAGRIRTRFEFRRNGVGAGRFDNEVRSGSSKKISQKPSRFASSRPESIVWPVRQ